MKLKNLLQGRLGRARYFLYTLITVVPFYLVLVNYIRIFGFPGDELFAVYTAFFFPIVVLTIRRLHDLNLSGWWALLIPISFAICNYLVLEFLFSTNNLYFVQFVFWLMVGLNVIAFPLLFFWKGTSGSNRFGEAPLK